MASASTRLAESEPNDMLMTSAPLSTAQMMPRAMSSGPRSPRVQDLDRQDAGVGRKAGDAAAIGLAGDHAGDERAVPELVAAGARLSGDRVVPFATLPFRSGLEAFTRSRRLPR